MHDSSTGEDRGPAAMEVALPLPRRVLEVAVGHPRRLTAPEWILLEILDAFPDPAPPLRVCAEELGLPDAGLLEAARTVLLREGMLSARSDSASSAAELKGLAITDLGRAFLRKGKVPGRPVWHRVQVEVDPIMGTLVDRRAAPGADVPRADPARVEALLTEVARPLPGLAAVRKWVNRSAKHLVEGDHEVVDARWVDGDAAVGAVEPGFGWAACTMAVERDAWSGTFAVRVKGHGREARAELLARLYPEAVAELTARAEAEDAERSRSAERTESMEDA